MKIKSITISGMHNIIGMPKTYNFKDINYLVGRNGAGKSTVLQAIQLAVLGYIPGTDKRVSEIFTHCPAKAMTIDLRLTNDDNVTDASHEDVRILRSWSVKGRNIQSNVSVSPEGFEISSLASQIELPIFNFNEFLGLSRNQLKSWFLNFLPKPSCKIIWKDEFTKTIFDSGYILQDAAYIDEVVQEGTDGDEGLQSVQNTHFRLKELLAAKKIEVARLEGAVQALIFYDDVSAEDYEESRDVILRCLQDIKNSKNKIYQAKNKKSLNDSIQARIRNYEAALMSDEDIARDEAIVESYQKKAEELTESCKELSSQIETCRTEYILSTMAEISDNKKIIDGKGICPYTHHECYEINKTIEKLKEETKQLEENLTASKKRESDFRDSLDVSKRELDKLKFDYLGAQSRLDNQKNTLQTIESAKSQIQELSDEEIKLLASSIEELDSQEAKLQEDLSKLEANHAYEEKINSITANKYKAENEMEALKLFIKRTDANNMQTEIAELPFSNFTEEMNTIIPSLFGEGIEFKVNLESKANSFSFGIIKISNNGEIYVPYDLMSSGEKTLLAFAMMVYIVKKSSASLKLVMIDDMLDHLDDANISSLFEKFSDSEVQIINAGVKPLNDPNVNIIEI